MKRRSLRHVVHSIRRAPGTTTTVAASCLVPGCKWEHSPATSAEECELACMAHTGRTHHMLFGRTFTDVAVVERAQ
ncbi:DUF7848 domain-containing protein [Streptomyces sp. NRRL F-4335]|uniref:DUF7848 domain-containing protein n=1 Tax=Streptomyces sp. NBC_01439 TaxID=2903867 RepID=UPI00069CB785